MGIRQFLLGGLAGLGLAGGAKPAEAASEKPASVEAPAASARGGGPRAETGIASGEAYRGGTARAATPQEHEEHTHSAGHGETHAKTAPIPGDSYRTTSSPDALRASSEEVPEIGRWNNPDPNGTQ